MRGRRVRVRLRRSVLVRRHARALKVLTCQLVEAATQMLRARRRAVAVHEQHEGVRAGELDEGVHERRPHALVGRIDAARRYE